MGAVQQWQHAPSHFAAFPVPGQQLLLSNTWAALSREINRNLLSLTHQQQQQGPIGYPSSPDSRTMATVVGAVPGQRWRPNRMALEVGL